MKYLIDKKTGMFIRNEADVPYLHQFIRELEPILKHDFKIKYGTNVLVIGSFLGWTERYCFRKGVATVTTVEPHPEHIKVLEYAREMGNQTTWKTVFQQWNIYRFAVHNRYEIVQGDTFKYDSLHVPATSTAFSTVESRGRYSCRKHIETRVYRFLNTMKGLYENKIYPTHIIMDFDGVGATLIDYKNLFKFKQHGYTILANIRDDELARLSDDYWDKFDDICNTINLRYKRITNNFITLY
jgi:hypothetical protein